MTTLLFVVEAAADRRLASVKLLIKPGSYLRLRIRARHQLVTNGVGTKLHLRIKGTRVAVARRQTRNDVLCLHYRQLMTHGQAGHEWICHNTLSPDPGSAQGSAVIVLNTKTQSLNISLTTPPCLQLLTYTQETSHRLHEQAGRLYAAPCSIDCESGRQ